MPMNRCAPDRSARVPGPVPRPGLALALALLLALPGCAAQGGVQSSEWRLQSLEEASLAAKEAARRQEAEIEALRNRVRALESGRPAPASQVSAPLAGETALPVTPAEERAAPAVLEPVPASPRPVVQSPMPSPVQQPAPAEAPAPEPQAAPPPPPAPLPVQAAPPAPEPKAPGPSGTALYNQGLQAYNAKKPEEAREKLTRFVAENPADTLTPNACYWIGETYYDQRDYAQAILAFKEVPRRFKDSEKTPAALLKIAYCYEKLGDRNNAVFYLRTLIEEFPAKEPAKAARTRLKELGG